MYMLQLLGTYPIPLGRSDIWVDKVERLLRHGRTGSQKSALSCAIRTSIKIPFHSIPALYYEQPDSHVIRRIDYVYWKPRCPCLRILLVDHVNGIENKAFRHEGTAMVYYSAWSLDAGSHIIPWPKAGQMFITKFWPLYYFVPNTTC